MERAEAGVVLRAGFAKADVAFDHLDDVGLLLDGLFEVGHGSVLRIRRELAWAGGGCVWNGWITGLDRGGRRLDASRISAALIVVATNISMAHLSVCKPF